MIDRVVIPESGWEIRAEITECSVADAAGRVVAEYRYLPILSFNLVRFEGVPEIRMTLEDNAIIVRTTDLAPLVRWETFRGYNVVIRAMDGR